MPRYRRRHDVGLIGRLRGQEADAVLPDRNRCLGANLERLAGDAQLRELTIQVAKPMQRKAQLAERVALAADSVCAGWTPPSEAARAITGTSWSGPRFFGLKDSKGRAKRRAA